MERTAVINEDSHLLRGESAAEPLGPVTGCTVQFADGRTLHADEDLVRVLNLLLDTGLASRRAQVVVDTEWVAPETAATMLGVSRPTIYKWMDSGVLGWHKVGARRRVAREDIETLLRARATRALTEQVLVDKTLEDPLPESEYRKAMFAARRDGGPDTAADLRRAQMAAKARQAAQRAAE